MIFASLLPLLLLGSNVYGVPFRRAADDTLEDLMAEGINVFLSGRGTGGGDRGFFGLRTWKGISFAGESKTLDNNTDNAAVFAFADLVPREPNDISFSIQYQNFIQEVSKLIKLDSNDTTPELEEASKIQSRVCSEDVFKVVSEALKVYNRGSNLQTSSTTDPAFLRWATMNYAPYADAQQKCQAAKNNHDALFYEHYGDNVAIFASAVNNIRAIAEVTKDAIPGVTTTVREGAFADAGVTRPAYAVPALDGVLSAWQEGGITEAPFIYRRNDSNGTFSSEHESTSAGLDFSWRSPRFSASGAGAFSETDDKTNVSVSSASFQVSFTGAATFDIIPGMWFDNFRAAHALLNPPDNVTAIAKPAFDRFFGTRDKPGLAAIYNSHAVVVYKPSISFQLSSNEAFTEFKTLSASGKICIFFFCIGANHEKESEYVKYSTTESSVTITDPTNSGYVVGFLSTLTSQWNYYLKSSFYHYRRAEGAEEVLDKFGNRLLSYMAVEKTSLEAASEARKERLIALKKRRDGIPDEPVFKNRNFDPTSRTLKKHTRDEDEALVDTVEKNVSGLTDKILAEDEEMQARDLDVFNIQPKRPNWDLKRETDKKLAKLQKRTNDAIHILIRQRLASQNADSSDLLDAMKAQEKADNEDSDEED